MNVPPMKFTPDALADFEASAVDTHTPASDFMELTKARLNLMVLITTFIGFVIARPGNLTGQLDGWLLLQTLIGTGLCAAAASVLNQAWECVHDAKMTRTADRPIPAGRMTSKDATLLGLVMAICGVATLAVTVNVTAALLAAATIALYVLVYTPLKRITTLNTLVGAVPGAIPPVIGYAAASGKIDLEALGLFAILFCWQMPHFLAIAILCKDDYANAGYKMMPVVDRTLTRTSGWIVFFGLMLILASLIPVWTRSDTGLTYTIAAISLGGAFLATGVRCAALRTRSSARVAFFASLFYLPLILGALMVDRLL